MTVVSRDGAGAGLFCGTTTVVFGGAEVEPCADGAFGRSTTVSRS